MWQRACYKRGESIMTYGEFADGSVKFGLWQGTQINCSIREYVLSTWKTVYIPDA